MTAVSGGCRSYGPMVDRHRPVAPRPVTFIRDIPLGQRHQICRMLDAAHSWINLAALLGFNNDDVQSFKQALYRTAGSPTDEMLTVWDYGCHTVTELYLKLYEMKHARCMMVLKDFVDANVHHLIEDVQGIQPPEEGSCSAETVHAGHPHIPPVEYIPGAGGQSPHARKSSQGSWAAEGNHPAARPTGPPQAAQGSWHGADGGKPQQAAANDVPHRRLGPSGGEGLTVNINKGSSEKVIGLGSPFKGWQGERAELGSSSSSSVNYKSGGKGELTSGASGGPASSVHSQEMGEKEKMGEREKQENYQNQSALSLLMHISYEEILQATNDFNSTYKLGEGSFGIVYHAVIKLTHYAVKQLKQNEYMGFDTDKIARADQMKELRALVTYRNPYIVALCAYCFDGPMPCLVYEFMENGSLEDNLLCKAQKGPLDWKTRHKIAEGAALGINFLHKAQKQPLIHGDIKSANILLGKHMEPKIADFGLARFGPEDGKTYCYLKTKNAHGTLPYLPEEFKRNFKLSTKVDVYSFGVVLLEILAGERVADSRREPNKLLTDIVEEALELEEPEAVIDKIRDRRCPDWPWDIASHLLDLARKCTTAKFTQRPEIDEAVNTLMNIAAEISRRDEMQKQREDFPVQTSQRRSPEGFRDPYFTPPRYSGQEMMVRYPPACVGSPGQDGVSMRRHWSIESNNLVTGPGLTPDPRFEGQYPLRHPLQQRAQSYDPGHYPYAHQAYGGPRAGFEPGYRRHISSETSEENNLVGEDKMIDSTSLSLSSMMTSYDMQSHMTDPSMRVPLLYQSQSSVPSSMSYAHHQQSMSYSPPVYDPRQPYLSQQQVGYRTQAPQQRYPQHVQAQYQNVDLSMGGNGFSHPQPEVRYPAPDAYAAQSSVFSTTSDSVQGSLALQDHMKQLDISQLPTKPIGGPSPMETAARRPQPPAPRRQAEQNTDVLPGYKTGLKEKSVRPPSVSSISEECEKDGTPLRSSLTTAEMRKFLDGKPREPTQQTEKMHGASSDCLTGAAASRQDTANAATGPDGSSKDALQLSLTTVQMKEFLPGKREPTEETEESTTEKLNKALSLAAATHQSKIASQSSATATEAAPKMQDSDGGQTEVSLTTTQMQQFLPSQRRRPAQDTESDSDGAAEPAEPEQAVNSSSRAVCPSTAGNTGPLTQRAFEESEICCSAPANMAAPLLHGAPATTPRREPGQMTEPLNGNH